MFLKSIHLNNVKTFEDIQLDFLDEDSIRKWTLLLGENGTGKSTLLKSIALITAGSDALADLIARPDEWIRYGEEKCRLGAVLVTSKLEERTINLILERGDDRKSFIIRNEEGLNELDRALSHSKRSYFVGGYGATRRISSEESRSFGKSPFSSLRARSVTTLFDPDAQLNPLESWAMRLDYRLTEGEEGIGIVRSVLSEFLPQIKFHKIDKVEERLMFETEDGIIPLRSLSDGYQSAAAWVGDLLYHLLEIFEDHSAPLDARGLLLMDEIDLHLHPVWQRELLSFLDEKLPNFQIIATTHSPFTAQQAAEGQLHILTRQESGVQIEKFSGNPGDFLLSQFVTSGAFGIDTEASLEIEEAKKERATLKRKKKGKKGLSKKEQDRFDELEAFLLGRPVGGRGFRHLPDDDAQLLKDIRDELRKNRK